MEAGKKKDVENKALSFKNSRRFIGAPLIFSLFGFSTHNLTNISVFPILCLVSVKDLHKAIISAIQYEYDIGGHISKNGQEQSELGRELYWSAKYETIPLSTTAGSVCVA